MDAKPNSTEQVRQLERLSYEIWNQVKGRMRGFALVAVLPDGCVTSSLLANDVDSFALLASLGPRALKEAVERMLQGHGITRVEADD